MDHPVTYESALKRSLLQDVTSFIRHFRSDALLNYSDFLRKWSEMDFDLLALVSTPEHILTCLIQLGLFWSLPVHSLITSSSSFPFLILQSGPEAIQNISGSDAVPVRCEDAG